MSIDPINLAVLHGTLSSPPRPRVLPSGDCLVALEVTVRRGDVTDSVPVVWFDDAGGAAFEAGDPVVVIGRVRRRFFRAGDATRSATEVVADAVVPATQRAKVRRSIERAVAEVVGTAGG